MKTTAFHIPRQSLMSNAKQHKPAAPRAINHISVVSSVQSRIDNDRRRANRKASI
jgi:hypothetical protein